MANDVGRWIRSCLTCAKRKRTRNMHAAEPGRVCTATYPGQKWAIDVVSPKEKTKEGYTKILTLVDVFTRYVLAIPLRKAGANEVMNALFTNALCVFGKPTEIISDNGTEFLNDAMELLLKKWGIRQHHTGGYQPQANPVERYHRFLNAVMTMLCSRHGENWAEYLPAALYAYNTSVCDSTGFSPHQLMFHGRDANLLEDIDAGALADQLGLNETPTGGDAAAFHQEANRRLKTAYTEARRRQELAAAKRGKAVTAKEGTRQKVRVEFKPDDLVLYWEPSRVKYMQLDAKESKRPSKWTERWTGPHKIVARGKTPNHYVIFHEEKSKRVETYVNRLSKFVPWNDGIVSTSWKTDEKRKFQTGAWVEAGALVLVPLTKPFPFGIAKLLDCDNNGYMRMQWYGNTHSKPEGKYEPGWVTPQQATYYAPTPLATSDKPYLTEVDKVTMHQRDVLLHSFQLTNRGKLPEALLRKIAEHPLVWWQPKRFAQKEHKQ